MTELKIITDAGLLAALNRPLQELHLHQHPQVFKPFDAQGITQYFSGCLADDSYLHIGAFVQGVPAGYVQAQVLHKPANPFARGYSYIHVHQLSVEEAYRSRGIARALMDAVHAHALDRGVEMVDLTVWQFNETAQAFYESMGYQFSLLRMYKEIK